MFTTPFTYMKQAGGGGTLSCVVQCFTANGTWFCCTGAFCLEIVAVGGGAGGRPGSAGTNSDASTCIRSGGPGGGAGGVVVCTLTSGFGTSQCVRIGSAGAGGIGGNASNPETSPTAGGSTCFGALVIASGGGIGNSAFSSSYPPGICISGGAGGNGSPNGAYACVDNNYGQNGIGGSATGKPGSGGAGFGKGYQNSSPDTAGGAGSTICGITLGSGGAGGSTNGSAASGYGGGGGGGARPANFFCNAGNGGNGGAGILQVTQYILS